MRFRQGCSQTVCDMSWLNNYLDALSVKDRKEVVESKIDTEFKFVNGKTVESIKVVKILAQIGNKAVDMLTEVIDE